MKRVILNSISIILCTRKGGKSILECSTTLINVFRSKIIIMLRPSLTTDDLVVSLPTPGARFSRSPKMLSGSLSGSLRTLPGA